jgi:DNA-binding MarR family transcriptional regulator
MDNELATFERLMEEVTRLIARAESLHTPRFDFGTGIGLYRSEIHTVETIGRNPGINMTRLAEKMGVTKGAVSQMVGRLAKKGLVEKGTMPGNEKEVVTGLTDLGRRAFENHGAFHLQMLGVLRDYYGDTLASHLERFRELAHDLSSILSLYERRMKGQ